MKKHFLSIIAALVPLCAVADDGMWLPNLISARIADMQAKGFRLSAEDIYSVNQASLKVKRETLQPIIDAFARAVEK